MIMRKTKSQCYRIHSFLKEQNLELIAWSDAAWAKSDPTEGILIGMSTAPLREGNEAAVDPISAFSYGTSSNSIYYCTVLLLYYSYSY